MPSRLIKTQTRIHCDIARKQYMTFGLNPIHGLSQHTYIPFFQLFPEKLFWLAYKAWYPHTMSWDSYWGETNHCYVWKWHLKAKYFECPEGRFFKVSVSKWCPDTLLVKDITACTGYYTNQLCRSHLLMVNCIHNNKGDNKIVIYVVLLFIW